jgi:rare lipoprotein A
MADGTRFDPASNAAASKTLPLGTTARVTNLENGRSALVTVRDRGPYVAGRVLDVSPADARRLGMKRQGLAPVAITPLRRHSHRHQHSDRHWQH